MPDPPLGFIIEDDAIHIPYYFGMDSFSLRNAFPL